MRESWIYEDWIVPEYKPNAPSAMTILLRQLVGNGDMQLGHKYEIEINAYPDESIHMTKYHAQLEEVLPPSENETILQAINTFGKQAQVDMAIEEMSELIQALLHERRGRRLNIPEELADVKIMCDQLELIFNCKEQVADIINGKMSRLKARIEERMAEDKIK